MLRNITQIFLVLLVTMFATYRAGADETSDDFTGRTKRLDAWLEQQAEQLHLPGLAIAAFEKDQPLHLQTIGRVDADAAMLIGSCTKTFTALATLIALQEHGIPLDTEVSDVLPNLQFGLSGKITIRNLLQHRSGIARADGFRPLPTLEQLEAKKHVISSQSTSGEEYQYSNVNYAIIGLIIEKVTGQSYCDFVQERVFVPLGMTHSGCGRQSDVQLAVEHQYAFGYPVAVAPTVPTRSAIPAGFIHASAKDMGTFMMCIMNDGVHENLQVFPRALIEEMKTPAGDQEFGYGMGLTRGSWGPERHVLGHEGATHTSYALAAFLPEDERGLVLLTNINLFDPVTDQGESLFQNALGILDGQDPTPIRPYVIWLRWVVLALTLLTCLRMLWFLRRWQRDGFPIFIPGRLRTWLDLLGAILIPIAIWYLVLRFWARTPLTFAYRSQPDLVGACLLLTALGIARSAIKIISKQPTATTDSAVQHPVTD